MFLKRLIWTWALAGLLGGLSVLPAAQPEMPPIPAAPPAPAAPEVLAPGLPAGEPISACPAVPEVCAPSCCYEAVCKKKCVAVPETKKHTHTCYGCKCLDVCLPKCKLGCGKGCDCEPGCTHCGKPRIKKVLLKKFVVEEECSTKCEVVHETEMCPVKPRHGFFKKAPCCPAPMYDLPAGVVVPAEPGAAKGPEPLAAPKEEKKE